MRCAVVILALLWAQPSWAAEAVVRDAGTLQLGDTVFRLNGIDAPAFDQTCVDNHAEPWPCGVEARDQLVKLIGSGEVHCVDLGADDTSSKSSNRRNGFCTVAGQSTSLNQAMVRLGYAMNLEPSAKGHFKADETTAQEARAGLWKGCFAAPQHFRQGLKTAPLFGAACRKDKDAELRAMVFPTEPSMPPGCAIKAQFARRARLTGHVGIYQLQGCPSYPALTKPVRWFCSEDDARAAGFRRAFNCRSSAKRS